MRCAQNLSSHRPPTAQSPPSWRAPHPRQTNASLRRAIAFARTNPPSHDFVRPILIYRFRHSPPGRNYHRGTGIRACVHLTSREVQVQPFLLQLRPQIVSAAAPFGLRERSYRFAANSHVTRTKPRLSPALDPEAIPGAASLASEGCAATTSPHPPTVTAGPVCVVDRTGRLVSA